MRPSSVITTLLSVLLAFLVWFMFAPTQLGGQVTYVIVDGNSMEPGFHRGDLLLIRKTSEYRIGDAVTYRDEEMKKFVFHRIFSLNLDRYILKGDNNAWLDPYQPTRQDIVGKLWIHIPKIGKVVERLRLPASLAVAVGLLGGSLMYGMIKPKKKEKKNSNSPGNFAGSLEYVLYGIGFFVLIFLGLCIFAFTRPLTTGMGNVIYQQEGKFFYSADGAPGIYDSDKVRSGEPIFPKLTCFLNIGYSYNLTAAELQEVAGKHQLFARVVDEKSGWQRTLPMTSENVFNGNTFMSMSTLDLCQVQALVAMVEQETGLHESTYTLEIVAHAAVSARIAGKVVNEAFEPVLRLKFDDVHFYVAPDGNQEDSLHFSKQGMVQSTALQPNTLSFLGLHPSVQLVRVIGVLGLLLALLALLGIGWSIFMGKQSNRDALIRLKYGSLLLDVQEYPLGTTSPLIDVNTIDDLARLAERQNTLILHVTNYYLVQTEGITYRYVTGNENNAIVEVQPVRRQTVAGIGRTRNNGLTVNQIFNGDTQMREHPIASIDPPQKIILRYTLNTNGNADLNFDSDWE